jgi:arylsulfatase A-like enzyme
VNLDRRQFHLLMAGAPFVFPPRHRRPNFVIIMADDMGFSDVGCYGSEISTPHIDRMAREGVRYTQFYNCARCCPTRASLLTGIDNHLAGIGHMIDNLGYPAYQGYLNDRCVTFAETLRRAGYQTYMSGKWHVGEQRPHWPLDRGFQRYFGLISGACSYFRLDPGRMMAIDDRPYVPNSNGFYMTDAITDHAVAMLRDSEQKPDPFCLYVAYTAPHWPLHALQQDIDKYRGRYRKGWDVLRQERYERQLAMGIIERKWRLSPRYEKTPAWDSLSSAEQDDWDLRMAVYAAQIDRMDQGIGRILDALHRTGRLHDTIVFFLSDNGGCAEVRIGKGPAEQDPSDPRPGGPNSFTSYRPPWANVSDTPFRLFKHYVHEGGISTPFVVWSPGLVKRKNALEHSPAHVTDIHPTLLALAEAAYPETFRGNRTYPLTGQDLWPTIQGVARPQERRIAWEHIGGRALREGDWKLVAEFDQPWSLYNLAEDRTELNDLAASEPLRVLRMAAQWHQWADAVGVIPWKDIKKNKSSEED